MDTTSALAARTSPTARPLLWSARVSWVLLAVTGLGGVLPEASDPVRLVGTVIGWTVWAVALLALLLPTTASLTTVRLVVPVAPVLGALSLAEGGGGRAIALIALGLLTTSILTTGELGELFVQGSAYGAERRLPLRPPGALVPVLVALWAAITAGVLGGPLLLAGGEAPAGTAVIVATIAAAVFSVPRFHRLAQRWIVVVPSGLVVHDPLALAETFMATGSKVAAVRLAPADTGAADATAGALGPAVEIELTEFETVVLADRRAGGRALHTRALLVSPTRPGRAVAAWSTR